MDCELVFLQVANILDVSETVAQELVQNALSTEDPFSSLADLLGFSNIDLIFEIIKNKDEFTDNKNCQALFIEQIIPEVKSILTRNKLKTTILKEDKKYFSYSEFNPVQSVVFNDVYKTDCNLLISAPTGAGKTDIAILAVLKALRSKNSTIIYIVPMKALASEIFRKFKNLFSQIKVIEFTGDTETDSKEILDARIVICTPEKFDVSTRRMSILFRNLKLVIIDEIHLLDDDRGPVLEAIVARIFRSMEYATRIIGLSATLPNYKDVAKFIKAEKIHYFDKSYRPVPLRMTITGFTEISKYSDECDYLISKIQEFLLKNKQILIFVHSRAKTSKLAMFLSKNLKISSSFEISDFNKLKGDLLSFAKSSIGIHHAGMCFQDRSEIEKLFTLGKLKIIICTSTLAWGVNLPAYCVIIHGSTFYNPLKGKFDDLGVLDILQIFGRAGRPQYDKMGEAFLLTRANKIDTYLKLLKNNRKIESKLLFHVPENLNAEIYLNNISTISTALRWLRNTFLFVRILDNPAYYGILGNEINMEEQALSQYVYLTIKRLEDCGLIKITRKDENYITWVFESTVFGKIASLFYINHLTMHTWLTNIYNIKNQQQLIDLLSKFEEFKFLSVRTEEITYLANIHNYLLINSIIDFEFDESLHSKLLLLLISFINYQKMPIFTLSCDLDYLIDNMKRLIAALKLILLHIKQYDMFLNAFELEKCLYRYKKIKSKNFTIKATRIDENFVDLEINLKKFTNYVVFINHNNKLEYAYQSYGNNNHIFKYPYKSMNIEIHTNINWEFYQETICPNYIPSLTSLYMYGIHYCGTNFRLSGNRTECGHFIDKIKIGCSSSEDNIEDKLKNLTIDKKKRIINIDNFKEEAMCNSESYNNIINMEFKLDFTFFEIEYMHNKERLKHITYLIYKLNLDSVMIICPNHNDVIETYRQLNILNSIDNMNCADDVNKKYQLENSKNKTNKRSICTLLNSQRHFKFENIIFKGISDDSKLLPIFEIYRLAHKKKCFIFDHLENMKLLKYLNE